MQWPFKKFTFGTRYGVKGKLWQCGWHSGLDLMSVSFGGDGVVYPLYAGTVSKVAKNSSYGNYVLIKHLDGYITLYGHLAKVLVQKGMVVTEDVALGYEGATGNATGKHLHIEVHKGTYSYPSLINPMTFVNSRLEEEKMKKIRIRLNGVEKVVQAIESGGNNYVRLQDLRDNLIAIGYDSAKKMPTVDVK